MALKFMHIKDGEHGVYVLFDRRRVLVVRRFRIPLRTSAPCFVSHCRILSSCGLTKGQQQPDARISQVRLRIDHAYVPKSGGSDAAADALLSLLIDTEVLAAAVDLKVTHGHGLVTLKRQDLQLEHIYGRKINSYTARRRMSS